MRKKIVVLGSAGMAGHVITRMLNFNSNEFKVVDVSRGNKKITPAVCLDVSNFEKLRDLIEKECPDFIINCVGVLNKAAEENPDRAILLNSYLPHFLESITRCTESKVIHISTDCVFSGAKGAYKETDLRDGQGFYSQSKALGELINGKDLTIRTSIIGPEISNRAIGLFDWVMRQDGEIEGYVNAIWSGLTTIQLAKTMLEIIKYKQLSGLIHLTNNVPISKFELLSLIKAEFGLSKLKIIESESYSVDKSLISSLKEMGLFLPDYPTMIAEMRAWIESEKHLYNYHSKMLREPIIN